MLATVVPADVHQLDAVERAAAVPGGDGAVGALAFEEKLDRDQPAAAPLAPAGDEVGADVAVEHGVDILEQPGPDEVGLVPELLLGDPRPEHQRARDVLALHDLLHRERGGHDERLPGIVPFAVPRRPLHQRVAIGDARFLRGLRDAVDVGAERDDRCARAPACDPRGRDAGDPPLDREPVRFENTGDIPLSLELLEPQLAEAEDGVDHLLGEVAPGLDVNPDLLLEVVEPRVGVARRGRGHGRLWRLLRGNAGQHRGDGGHAEDPWNGRADRCHGRLL